MVSDGLRSICQIWCREYRVAAESHVLGNICYIQCKEYKVAVHSIFEHDQAICETGFSCLPHELLLQTLKHISETAQLALSDTDEIPAATRNPRLKLNIAIGSICASCYIWKNNYFRVPGKQPHKFSVWKSNTQRHGKRVVQKGWDKEEAEHRTSTNLQLKGLLKNSTVQTLHPYEKTIVIFVIRREQKQCCHDPGMCTTQ